MILNIISITFCLLLPVVFFFIIRMQNMETNRNLEKYFLDTEKTIQTQFHQVVQSIQQISQQFDQAMRGHESQIINFIQNHGSGIENIRQGLEKNLTQLRLETQQQLDKVRVIVDEKLQSTLEQRLNASFRLVGERIDSIHLGLGEMQKIAREVSSLQKVLSNVKTRGILGEIQLDRILTDILTTEQYEKNVKTKKNSNAIVEYAIKIPNKSDDGQDYIWLPIDAKFPTADYQKLIDAYEIGDMDQMQAGMKSLEQQIKVFAKDIRDKYIDSPYTTDFGILFLPTEGLYSEILRISGLAETLRRDYQIVVSGPATLAAFLNSLQLGFKTLTVEKRTREITRVLGAVKTDFNKFGELLDKTQRKLDEASKQIGDATFRSKQITRKLNKVEGLPMAESQNILEIEDGLL